MNILITGCNGQLGNEMQLLEKDNPQHTFFNTDVAELDITDQQAIEDFVANNAIDGIVTGCILAIGRITGESAALLFTAGFAHALNGFFDGLTSAGASLTVALYVYAKEQGEFEVAFAIAAILMVLTLLINLAALFTGKFLKKRRDT